jgi:uncharacterized protein (TIGR00725 family)
VIPSLPNTVWRRPVVGVMGSGRQAHEDRAVPLGRWLAGAGVHLLTGGGEGVMAAVSRAFHESPGRAGAVVGVLPGDPESGQPLSGYPNRWVELAIRTHLPLSGARGIEALSRNHVNVLSADVVVALPGGQGTASEAALAVRYGRPVIAFVGSRDEIPELPSTVPVASSLEEVARFVTEALAGSSASHPDQ